MYENLVQRLRNLSGTDNIAEFDEASDAIEDLSAHYCPHAIRNVHDRGDDSLCNKWLCEVASLPNWIPVTERLPTESKHYLAVINGTVGEAAFYAPAEQWLDPIEEWENWTRFVTHWQPFPPPKEET